MEGLRCDGKGGRGWREGGREGGRDTVCIYVLCVHDSKTRIRQCKLRDVNRDP